MTRIHLLDITLAPLSTPEHTIPLETQLVAEILDEDKLITRSEPASQSESEGFWTFEINSDIPQSCSCFAIKIAESSFDRSLDFHFKLLLVELKDVISSACGNKIVASLATQIATSTDCAFRLRAIFMIEELLVFPLDERKIRDTLRAMLPEEKPLNAYDLAIVCDSVHHLQITNRNRSRFLNLLGHIYTNQYIKSHSVKDLTEAIDMHNQALRDATWNDDQRMLYMSDYGRSLYARYKHLGEINDLNNAVDNIRKAVHLTPDGHQDKISQLNILADSLLTRFKKLGEISDLNGSIVKFQEVMQLTPESHPSKPSCLNNLGISLLARFNQLGRTSDLNDSIIKLQEMMQLAPNGHPDKPSWLNNLGISLLRRFEQFQEINDLSDSIDKTQEAVQLTPDDHHLKPILLNNLGSSLFTRFEQLGEASDLNYSIVKEQEALKLTPDGHSDKSTWLNNLGNSLFTRFEQFGEVGDLNAAVDRLQEAMQLTPDGHPTIPSKLNNLGKSLLKRFELLGEANDLNDSVVKFQEAVYLTSNDHPDKPILLNNLGGSLLMQIKQFGQISNLNDSIIKFQEAIQLTPDGHPIKLSLLSNLGNSLLQQFDQLGDISNLNDSVAKKQEAVQLTPDGHPSKPSQLNSLGVSLLQRFEQLGEGVDLDNSIVMFQKALQLAPNSHIDKPTWLGNLGGSLLRRFQKFGEINNLNDSVVKFQEALCLTPDGHIFKPSLLDNLGYSLLERFEQFGEIGDLNNSVVRRWEAVHLTPDGHSDMPSQLSNLGHSLMRRFERLGKLSDINDSVVKKQEAVQMTPDGKPDKPFRLNSLGNSLMARFERLGEFSDLDISIDMYQRALQLTPDGHPAKPLWLNNLGHSLLQQFVQHREISNLNDSVIKLQEAVQLTPNGHRDKPVMLFNLGESLLRRFVQLGDVNDVNGSVVKFQEAVELTPDGRLYKPSLLIEVGKSLLMRFLALKSSGDLNSAILAFSTATHAEYGAPSDRLRAAHAWAKCLHVCNGPPTAILEPYQVAIPLLTEVAWLGSSLSDRHYQIMKAGSIVHEAAVTAFKAGDYALAVKWLEQGRSVIWAQFLQLRTPLDNLNDQEPILCQQLKQNSIQLEGAVSWRQMSARNDLNQTDTDHLALSKENYAEHGHHLAVERKELLTKIRKIPGFKNFLLPKEINELTPAAAHGPIVILTHSELDCMCYVFILLPNLTDNVDALKLESFSPSKAKHLHNQLKQVLYAHGHASFSHDSSNKMGQKETFISRSHSNIIDSSMVEEALNSLIIGNQNNRLNEISSRDGNPLPPPHKNAASQGLMAILAELWECVVKPILDALVITKPSLEAKPRLWWCPTGTLSFLPFHAAGLYNRGAPLGSKLSDFVISSYIPTLSTLLDTDTHSSPLSIQPRLLAIAQSSSDNQRPLPGALEEIKYIAEAVKGTLPVTLISEKNATLEKVASELKTSNWVHFACHGVQDVANPTESALLLAGTDRLTLAKLATLQIACGDLAFLSACQTAKGDEQLSDEAVHLGAGMLAAGYRGVIATMWAVADHVAPQVALDVYKHLVSSNSNPTEAAHALHLAVQGIRENNKSDDEASLISWVPFIHLGK